MFLKTKKIKLSKFGGEVLPFPLGNRKNHLIPLHGKKSYHTVPYLPIATDGNTILSNGNTISVTEFFMDKNNQRVIVLTEKERFLLAEQICYKNVRVRVLESSFPIFEGLKYTGDLSKTYSILKSKINSLEIRKLYPTPLFRHFSDIHRRAIYRKIKEKSSLDSLYYFADLKSYQEVFKIAENSPDRIVFALDFNSMFASCLDITFPNPEYLVFKEESQELTGEISPGMYHVIFSKPKTDFIKNYHCFKHYTYAKNISFKLEDQHELELLVTSDELQYYKNHFECIHVKSSITSKQHVKHPRVNYSIKKYKERGSTHLSKADRAMSKINLVAIHSSTSPSRNKTRTFNDLTSAISYLSQKFQIKFDDNDNIEGISFYINSLSGFELYVHEGSIVLKYPDIFSNKSVISFSALIVAAARVKLMKALEYVLNFDSSQLCYVNTDSIHVSIDKNKADDFHGYIASSVGDKLGQLKIECCAKQGYWLDIGRYWLCDEVKVLKYRNIIFNAQDSNTPFISRRKMIKLERSAFITQSKSTVYCLKNSFSFTKKLDNSSMRFERFNYDDISSMLCTGNTLLAEKYNSANTKFEIFERLKDKFST
jgi:hypothetical protein